MWHKTCVVGQLEGVFGQLEGFIPNIHDKESTGSLCVRATVQTTGRCNT